MYLLCTVYCLVHSREPYGTVACGRLSSSYPASVKRYMLPALSLQANLFSNQQTSAVLLPLGEGDGGRACSVDRRWGGGALPL